MPIIVASSATEISTNPVILRADPLVKTGIGKKISSL